MGEIKTVSDSMEMEFSKFGDLYLDWGNLPDIRRWNLRYVGVAVQEKEQIREYFEFFSKQLRPLSVSQDKTYKMFAEHILYADCAESSRVKITKPLELEILNERNNFEITFSFESVPEGHEKVTNTIESKTAPPIYKKVFRGETGEGISLMNLALVPQEEEFQDMIFDYISKEREKNEEIEKLLGYGKK